MQRHVESDIQLENTLSNGIDRFATANISNIENTASITAIAHCNFLLILQVSFIPFQSVEIATGYKH